MDSGAAELQIDAHWRFFSAEESLRRFASSANGLTSMQTAAALVR